MNSDKIIDKNYNTKITLENQEEYYIFADRLHNENLDFWQGWKCSSGSTTIIIDPNLDVYGSMCRNDYLGNLKNNFKILNDYTICKLPECVNCTTDLMITKYRSD